MSWSDPSLKLSRLRDIGFERWDPIGVLSPEEHWKGHPAADEYDGYLTMAASLSRMGKPVDEVTGYLLEIVGDRMGLSVTSEQRQRARETAIAIRAYVEELDGDAALPIAATPIPPGSDKS
jgi:hypothetical protein